MRELVYWSFNGLVLCVIAAEFMVTPPDWMTFWPMVFAIPLFFWYKKLANDTEDPSVETSADESENPTLIVQLLFLPWELWMLFTEISRLNWLKLGGASGLVLVVLVVYLLTLAFLAGTAAVPVSNYAIEPIRQSETVQSFVTHMQEVRKERGRTYLNLSLAFLPLRNPIPTVIVEVLSGLPLAVILAPMVSLPCRALRIRIFAARQRAQHCDFQKACGPWARTILRSSRTHTVAYPSESRKEPS